MLNHKTKQEITARVIDAFSNKIDDIYIMVSFIVDQCALYYNKDEYKFKDDD